MQEQEYWKVKGSILDCSIDENFHKKEDAIYFMEELTKRANEFWYFKCGEKEERFAFFNEEGRSPTIHDGERNGDDVINLTDRFIFFRKGEK